ncbi:MAG: class I SAM-dependent methyltransferase [Myxococcota bacterium]|nr:class I SAM-dependent methyltransferase [Myxococcota bacterium]
MRLNRFEFAMMNNPVRAAIQRHFEAARLLRLGGAVRGGTALEMGCGRGVGAELVLDVFGAARVDAFDLDPRMVERARTRLAPRGERARFWVGDATSIPVPDASYDAVFDFGIIHHIPRWRLALAEVRRVLKPEGRFYAEEVLAPFLENRVVRRLLEHPEADRFDRDTFQAALSEAGLEPRDSRALWGAFAWFVADRPAA